ncbi:MAG: MBL fold metallo-hydrolase, partial [Gammaproteobacteria bacterium]|nr:MBL fold metallo-hydrolase [Gammaproteobacteria bacterium]
MADHARFQRSNMMIRTLGYLVCAATVFLGCTGLEGARADEPPASRIAELTQLKPEFIEVSDRVSLALGLGNVFLVTTNEGHVIIDTGVAQQSAAQRELLLAKHPGSVSRVIVTHGHGDHDGGVAAYQKAGAKFIAQRRYIENTTIEKRLAQTMARRNSIFWGGFLPRPKAFDPAQLSRPDVL